jgi:hypothetical protein
VLFEIFDLKLSRRGDDVSILDFKGAKSVLLRANILDMREHVQRPHLLGAYVTFEVQILIVLLDIPANLLWNVLITTVGACFSALSPLLAAGLTEDGLTAAALFGVLDDVVADRALEHVFEFRLRVLYHMLQLETLVVHADLISKRVERFIVSFACVVPKLGAARWVLGVKGLVYIFYYVFF